MTGPYGKSLMSAEAFERFVREHERMVRSLALSYCRDEHGAEDVVQEAFLRAYRSLDGLREPSKIKTWLYALTRNAALDHLRSRRRRATEELTVDVAAPEKKESELLDRVLKAVDRLREDYRQIILLRCIEKLSYDEIAAALGMTRSAVGEKLHRVRKLVLEKL